jgi:NADH-quinone oxidoreductase subunit N
MAFRYYGMTGIQILCYQLADSSPQINLLTLSLAVILIFVESDIKFSAPFHFWTPDVYEGAPIAIRLIFPLQVKHGFALLIRFLKTTFVSFVTGTDTGS